MIIVELILIGANKDGATYILSEDKEKIVIPSNKNRPINVYELCKKYTDVDSEWINPSPIYFYETSDDIIDEANAGEDEPEDPVEMAYNSAWETADYIISADIEIDPMRGGNGQVRVPFLDWRWRS